MRPLLLLSLAAAVACSSPPPAGNGPTLTAHVPASDATAVSLGAPLSLTFSAAMDPSMAPITLQPSAPLDAAKWDLEGKTATVTPTMPLAASTKYTVQVSGKGKDGAMLQAASFSFTTRAGLDGTPPTLTATSPTQLQQKVALNASLVLAFSEEIDTKTLSVITNPDFDWGTGTWATTNRSVTFSAPPAGLTADTTYTLTIDGDDLSGEHLSGNTTIIFTSAGPPDVVPPAVISVTPVAMASNVSPNSSVSIGFSEPVQPATPNAVSLAPAVSGLACVLDGTSTVVTCSHPVNAFAASTMYTLTVRGSADGGVKDLAGNVLPADVVTTFTTGTAIDSTPPTIVSWSPDGGLGFPYKPTIILTFSEPMDKASVQQALSVTQPSNIGSSGTFAWDSTGTQVSFNPATPALGYDAGTVVDWQVTTAAKDVAGNGLANLFQSSFKVRNQGVLVVETLSSDGSIFRSGYDGSMTVHDTYNELYALYDNVNGHTGRGFVYFDLAALPSARLGIYSAVWSIIQKPSSVGTFTNNRVVGEQIPWDVPPISTTSWASTAVCATTPCPATNYVVVSTTETGGTKYLNVTPWVIVAGGGRVLNPRIMFRLRMEAVNTSQPQSGGSAEYYDYESGAATRPKLTVTYEIP